MLLKQFIIIHVNMCTFSKTLFGLFCDYNFIKSSEICVLDVKILKKIILLIILGEYCSGGGQWCVMLNLFLRHIFICTEEAYIGVLGENS